MSKLENLYNFILQLRSTKGTNDKIDLLVKGFREMGEDLSDFLSYVYDTELSYYQTKLKETAYPRILVRKKDRDDLVEVYGVLADMSLKLHLGQAGAALLASKALEIPLPQRNLVQIILNRDIQAGTGIKSINKAYNLVHGKDLLFQYPYQRYDVMTKEKLAAMDFEQGVFSQLKSDGAFANLICHDGVGRLYSRSGSPIVSKTIDPICEELARSAFDGGVGSSVYLGELLVVVKATGEMLSRAVGNGKINSIIQTGVELPNEFEIHYRVWDIVPYMDWMAGICTIPYKVRWNNLTQLIDDETNNLVKLQECRVVHSFHGAIDDFKEKLERKEEGTMCKPFGMIWRDGDSKEGVKIKLEMTFEIKIVGYNDGDPKGKHASTFGSLQCESECGLMSVGVSGMTDDIRLMIHENREYYLGKIISVISNGVQDKSDNDLKSLFLPRLDEIRLDKSKANTLAEMYQITQDTIENISKIISKGK